MPTALHTGARLPTLQLLNAGAPPMRCRPPSAPTRQARKSPDSSHCLTSSKSRVGTKHTPRVLAYEALLQEEVSRNVAERDDALHAPRVWRHDNQPPHARDGQALHHSAQGVILGGEKTMRSAA